MKPIGALLVLIALAALPETAQQLPAAAVEGIVVDSANGSPLNGVRVLLRTQGDRAYRSAITDDAGRFAFNTLPPGEAALILSRDGYIGINLSDRIAPGSRYTPRVALTRSAAVSGRVYDLNREPAVGVQVHILRETFDGTGRRFLTNASVTRTDEKGEYRVTGLRPGRHYVRAAYAAESARRTIGALPVNANNVAPTYYPGVTRADEAQAIEVAAGADVQAIDFSIEPPSPLKVTGRIVNPFSPGDTDRYSYFLIPRNARIRDGNTLVADSDPDIDNFEIRGVPRGSYDLFVGFRAGPGFEHPFYAGRASFDVGDRDTSDITVTMDAGVDVAGSWYSDDAGATEPGIEVPLTFRPVDGMPELLAGITPENRGPSFVTDGRFTVPRVAPGRYVLSFTLPQNVYIVSARFGTQDVLGRTFDVDSNSAGPIQIEASIYGGMLEGTVNDRQGKAVDGAMVILVPAPNLRLDQSSYKNATTNAQGQFVIFGIRPGTYIAFAFRNAPAPNAAMNSEFLTQYLRFGIEVEIGKEQRLQRDLTAILPER